MRSRALLPAAALTAGWSLTSMVVGGLLAIFLKHTRQGRALLDFCRRLG